MNKMNDLNKLITSSVRLVGLKQVEKAISESDELRCVVLADDADKNIRDRVTALAGAKDIKVIAFAHKLELGRLCGIQVACAVVGIKK